MLFYAYFSVSRKRNIKRSQKRNEINWRSYFWKETHLMDLDTTSEDTGAVHEGGGCTPPSGHAPLSRGPLKRPPTDFFHLYISIYPKNIETEDRSGVPPPQASEATKNLSGACSGILPEGGSLTGGHLHHPDALHDEEGVVHPRG